MNPDEDLLVLEVNQKKQTVMHHMNRYIYRYIHLRPTRQYALQHTHEQVYIFTTHTAMRTTTHTATHTATRTATHFATYIATDTD